MLEEFNKIWLKNKLKIFVILILNKLLFDIK